MLLRFFKQVDVFTARPYYGNPLGVVLDGTGLSQEQMQHFTNWTNLSECAFFAPAASCRLQGILRWALAMHG
jgi:PhzF family phenazine biosynthesis protein